MAYAASSDVQELIAQFTISGTSKPTSTQLTDIIAQIAGEIDTVLGARGITVPVTTPAHFLVRLEALNAYGAAAGTLKSMFPDATGADETPAYAFWERRYRDGLAELKDGTGIPDGVIGSTAGYVAPSTYLTRNPDVEEDLGDIAEPFFTRSKVF